MKEVKIFVYVILVSVSGIGAQNEFNATFYPSESQGIVEDTDRIVRVTIERRTAGYWPISEQPKVVFSIESSEKSVANVQDATTPAAVDRFNKTFVFQTDEVLEFNFTIKGKNLGRAKFYWTLQDTSRGSVTLDGYYKASVVRGRGNVTVQIVVTVIIGILVSFNNINMGTLLDMQVIKSVLRKPIAPLIGFGSQFLFMPIASYGFGLIFFPDKNVWRLSLFTLGCSPGGTGSNFWTLLLDGDVDLSVTMTFFSTVAAVGMLPLWLFTLGRYISTDELKIPYATLFYSLIGLTIPLVIGLLIKHFKPKWAEWMKRIIKSCTFVLLIITIVGGTIVSLYMFKFFDLNVFGAALCIAWGGYIFGAVAATIFRLKKRQVIAISIETALQNPGIAFVLLQISLEEPDSDLGAIPVVCQLLVTGPPLILFYLVYVCFKRTKTVENETKTKTDTVAAEVLLSQPQREIVCYVSSV